MSTMRKSKKMRQGTKSCAECRYRKLKCIWNGDSAICSGCQERGTACVPQHGSPAMDWTKISSRERIGRLEVNVRQLQTSLLRIETSLAPRPTDEGYATDGLTGHSSHDPNGVHSSPAESSAQSQQAAGTSSLPKRPRSGSIEHLSLARQALQELLPFRSDIAILEPHVDTWMVWIYRMFPSTPLFDTGYRNLARYESMVAEDVNIVSLASYLCPLAICLMHIPPQHMAEAQFTSIGDVQDFVIRVSDLVESLVFNDDQLIATLPGIDMALMFLRLQLFRGRVRKVVVGLRRLVAICETMGLPKTAVSLPPGTTFDPLDRDYIAISLWMSVVSADRLAGFMWGLPMSAGSHKISPPSILTITGELNLLGVFVRMGLSAIRVVEIGEMFTEKESPEDIAARVMMADQEWRKMGELIPSQWWHTDFSSNAMLIYWYHYLGMRMHLRTALEGVAYSQRRCMESCRTMAVLYPSARGLLPAGTFIGRLLDIQALIAAVYLLYTHHKLERADTESTLPLIKGVVKSMDLLGENAAGEVVAEQVGNAIRTVMEALESSQNGEAHTVSLHVPTLGTVNVGARLRTCDTADLDVTIASQQSCPISQSEGAFASTASLEWLMEISEESAFVNRTQQTAQNMLTFDFFQDSEH